MDQSIVPPAFGFVSASASRHKRVWRWSRIDQWNTCITESFLNPLWKNRRAKSQVKIESWQEEDGASRKGHVPTEEARVKIAHQQQSVSKQ